MNGMSSEIRGRIDDYRAANGMQRLLIGADAMRQLFIAERIWRGINKVDMVEERVKGGME